MASAKFPWSGLFPDIVRLSAGDMIPADLRLLSTKDLFINQSALTGEAMPSEKSVLANAGEIADPFDLPNLCFMGGSVVSGFGTGVIVHTGTKTYFGQLADKIAGQRELTSFDKGVNRFTWLMIRFILVMVPAVLLINGLTKGDWLEALLFAVAVAVGLTPEMLPMIVTVNLAKGAIAMSKKRVIVKRLHAIQNFGAMDVLCTDKTGTLTQDRIILKLNLDIRGNDCERVLEFAYLNSRFKMSSTSGFDPVSDPKASGWPAPGAFSDCRYAADRVSLEILVVMLMSSPSRHCNRHGAQPDCSWLDDTGLPVPPKRGSPRLAKSPKPVAG
jgi:P-type Mg2+ transporter